MDQFTSQGNYFSTQAQSNQFPFCTEENSKSNLHGRNEVYLSAYPINKNPKLPRSSKYSTVICFLFRWRLPLPRSRTLLWRERLQQVEKSRQISRGKGEVNHQTGQSRHLIHAWQWHNSSRYQARKYLTSWSMFLTI